MCLVAFSLETGRKRNCTITYGDDRIGRCGNTTSLKVELDADWQLHSAELVLASAPDMGALKFSPVIVATGTPVFRVSVSTPDNQRLFDHSALSTAWTTDRRLVLNVGSPQADWTVAIQIAPELVMCFDPAGSLSGIATAPLRDMDQYVIRQLESE